MRLSISLSVCVCVCVCLSGAGSDKTRPREANTAQHAVNTLWTIDPQKHLSDDTDDIRVTADTTHTYRPCVHYTTPSLCPAKLLAVD